MAIKFEGSPHGGEARRGRRRSSIAGWLRDLISPEPADEKRRRIEAEAAAQLGLNSEQQPNPTG